LSGSGKSTVGPLLAGALGRPFVDLDGAISAAAGTTVLELFEREGEPAFRGREREALRLAAGSPVPSVIALGGGALLSAENRDRLRRSGDVLRLQAPVETLALRLGDAIDRPLLAGDVAGRLTTLAAEREGLHVMVTDAVVDANAPVEAVVQRCMGALGALS
jgi:shikimate kinase